jgi:hypothetical protein
MGENAVKFLNRMEAAERGEGRVSREEYQRTKENYNKIMGRSGL